MNSQKKITWTFYGKRTQKKKRLPNPILDENTQFDSKKEKYSVSIVLSFSRYRRLIVPNRDHVIHLQKSVIHLKKRHTWRFCIQKNLVRKDFTINRKMILENLIFTSQRKLFEVVKAFTSLCVSQDISAYFYLQFPSVTWCLTHSRNLKPKQNSFTHSQTDSNCK